MVLKAKENLLSFCTTRMCLYFRAHSDGDKKQPLYQLADRRWWRRLSKVPVRDGALQHTALGALPDAHAFTRGPSVWSFGRGAWWYSQGRQEGPNKPRAIWDDTAFPYWSPTLPFHRLSGSGRPRHQCLHTKFMSSFILLNSPEL